MSVNNIEDKITYEEFSQALVPGGPTLADVCGDELRDVAEKDRAEYLANFRTERFCFDHLSDGHKVEDSEEFTGETHKEVYTQVEKYALGLAVQCEATVEIYSHGVLEGHAYFQAETGQSNIWWK